MSSLMQAWPLTTDKLLDHAAKWHTHREVMSRSASGVIERKTYAQVKSAAMRLSNALRGRGLMLGDRVATLAMNSSAHLEAWYAISGIGCICHTLNPRLFDDQLIYIVNHAGDRLILADAAFAPLLARILPQCPKVEQVVYLSEEVPPGSLAVPAVGVNDFVAGYDERGEWGNFDEGTAAGLCYTSGTTGDPKGVLYSHRSNFLHTLISLQTDAFGFSVRDVILPVVPMYHANGWGIVFSAPAVGAKLVLPGAQVHGAALYELIATEGVTVAAGVPTVWFGLLQELAAHPGMANSLRRVIVGGAACPERLIRDFAALGIDVVHAWGMTEMSPLGGLGSLPPEVQSLSLDEQMPWRIKQGRSPCGIDLKLLGAHDEVLPHDGAAVGRLHVRGPGVVARYFGDDNNLLDADGYFDTGDIATIDTLGFMQITDRAKDIIKSGGEWISSLAIENALLLHPKVALAAVVGRPHPTWGERPVLYVQFMPGDSAPAEELLVFLRQRIASWWVPDEVIAVDSLPLGATGKVDKKVLRQAAS